MTVGNRIDKQVLMERLQEELEAVFDTCMHIETIVGQYFTHHKRPMEKLRQRSSWLSRDLYKLVMTQVLPLPKMKVQPLVEVGAALVVHPTAQQLTTERPRRAFRNVWIQHSNETFEEDRGTTDKCRTIVVEKATIRDGGGWARHTNALFG